MNRFYHSKELSMNYVDSDKKRKLQYDQLVLPLPKHKFRERSNGSDHESPTRLQKEENPHTSTSESNTDEGPVQSEESVNDSPPIFAGGYDATMTPVDRSKTIVSFGNQSPRDQSSTSSNSCSTKTFKDAHYSLDSRSLKQTNDKARASSVHGDYCELENTKQMKPKTPINDQLLEFGTYDDYIASSFEVNGIEQSSVTGAEGLMLYSNDVTSNGFVLSPDRCSNKEDARQGRPRKPTIDQEFEQYFSMLMLK